MTDRVTWGAWPHCGDPAAVGWAGDVVAEFHCPRGCLVTEEQLAELQRRGDGGA